MCEDESGIYRFMVKFKVYLFTKVSIVKNDLLHSDFMLSQPTIAFVY